MDKQEIIKKVEALEKRVSALEGKPPISQNIEPAFKFQNKKLTHSHLLQELLKSDYCHNKNGLTKEEILNVFKENCRPVTSKKVADLLSIWHLRRKIDLIKSKEEKQSRFFWIEHESK